VKEGKGESLFFGQRGVERIVNARGRKVIGREHLNFTSVERLFQFPDSDVGEMQNGDRLASSKVE